MIYRLFLVLALLLATSPAHAGYFGPAVASVTTYAPNPPTISAAVASSTSVTISKTADGTVDGLHSLATGYDLYRTVANGAADSETLWQADVTFPYPDTGLTTGATYRYKVKSKNTAGASATYSNEVSATPTASPTAPGAPTGVTATAGNAQATVTFSAPASDGGSAITGYTVTSSPAGGTDSNAGSTSLYHVVTGLTNGTAYTFTVTATNTAGTGAASSASNSVTPSAVTYIADAEFSGSSVDTGFTSSVSGAGATVNVASGNAALVTASVTDAGIIRYDTALPANKIWTVTVRAQTNTTADAAHVMMGITQLASAPTYGTAAGASILGMLMDPALGWMIQYQNAASQFPRWTPGSSSWSTATGWTSGTLVNATYYIFKLSSDGTNITFRVRDGNDVSDLIAPTTVPWTSVKTLSGNYYLYVGDDNATYSACNMNIDYIRVQ